MAFVYILRNGSDDLFKIGRTSGDVQYRIHQLCTGNPHGLTPFDVIEPEHDSWCEGCLHRLLRSKRSTSGSAREFFAVSPDELRMTIADVRRMLTEFIAERQKAESLAELPSDGRMLAPTEQMWADYRDLLEVRVEEDKYHDRREMLENRLKLAIGCADGLEGIATWKSQVSDRFDLAAFRSDHPALFEQYVRPSPSRVFRLT
jgi:hypothetical protein